MSAIVAGLTSAWVERVGWMLVHSVWEVGLIALAYSLLLVVMPRAASTARYGAGFVVLLCMILVLPVTMACMLQNPSPPQIAKNEPVDRTVTLAPEHYATQGNSSASTSRDESFTLQSADVVNRDANSSAEMDRKVSWHGVIIPILPWLTALWFVGVVLFSLRLLIGLAAVERLRRVGLVNVGSEIAALGASLARRLELRQAVKFAESALVQVPTVIGYLRPLVLLPAVPLIGLSTQEIEFLLAHELAHIRRHDYLHNLMQGVIETLLFYHPAMWWVSSCVRRERENCCDDLVVATLEHRAEYARTLFALEQRRTTWSPSLAATDGRLLQRIRRLIGSPADTSLGRQWGKGPAGFVVILLLSVPFAAAVLSLAAQREVVAAGENKKAGDAGKADTSTKQESTPAPSVRIVVGPNNKLTFDGEETTWVGVETLLQKVPDRGSTVLEVAISTEDLSVREMNNAISAASSHGRNLGFKYSSYIGVHPFGSGDTKQIKKTEYVELKEARGRPVAIETPRNQGGIRSKDPVETGIDERSRTLEKVQADNDELKKQLERRKTSIPAKNEATPRRVIRPGDQVVVRLRSTQPPLQTSLAIYTIDKDGKISLDSRGGPLLVEIGGMDEKHAADAIRKSLGQPDSWGEIRVDVADSSGGDTQEIGIAKLAAAKRRLERMERLHQTGAASNEEYEDAKDQVKLRRAELAGGNQQIAEGPKSQHLAFKPRHGMAGETSWTELIVSRIPGDRSLERLWAHVSLEGEFPVTRQGDKKPLFKVKLIAGRDESLNVKLTTASGESYNRILHRGKPLSWKLNGKTYQLLYPDTNVALDQPAESPFASIIVTCRSEEEASATKSSKDKNKSGADSGPHEVAEPREESSDDSKGSQSVPANLHM